MSKSELKELQEPLDEFERELKKLQRKLDRL
jgi:polyhydroxyalkanoate synthesis regulator phasin